VRSPTIAVGGRTKASRRERPTGIPGRPRLPYPVPFSLSSIEPRGRTASPRSSQRMGAARDTSERGAATSSRRASTGLSRCGGRVRVRGSAIRGSAGAAGRSSHTEDCDDRDRGETSRDPAARRVSSIRHCLPFLLIACAAGDGYTVASARGIAGSGRSGGSTATLSSRCSRHGATERPPSGHGVPASFRSRQPS
jgi:hypothetical protein